MKNVVVILFLFFNTFSYGTSLEKVSLQFHWLDQFEFAGYYMAKEKGFYKEAGLDVEFKKYQYGLDIVDEVIQGNATYAIGGSDLLVDISKGKQLYLLSAIFQSSPLVLLTTQDSGIKSIKDFKDKNIMLTPDTLNSVTFNAMLNKKNLSFKDLNIQKHSFDVNDLINGKTDLFQSYITNEPFTLKKAGVSPVIFDPKNYGFDFYSDILFTSENEVRNHKERMIAFKNATLRGWEYAFENIDESVFTIHKKFNSQKKSIEALMYEAVESKKLVYYGTKSIGDISLYKLNRMYDIFNILNLINNPIDIKKHIIETDDNWQIIFTEEEKEYLLKHPILTVSNEEDYPPYDYFEDGIAKGYSIDLIKLIASKLGVDIKFDTDNWNNLVKKFCDGKIDILHPTDKSVEVIECGEFTRPIIQDNSQFLVRNSFKDVTTIKDLYGYTVASPRGWQQTEVFKKDFKGKIKVVEVENTLEAIEYVRARKADFAFDYGNVLNYLKTKHGFNGLKVQGTFIAGTDLDNLYISVNKDNRILKNIVEKTINIISTGEISKLQNKWFGEKTFYDDPHLTKKEVEYLQNNEIKMCVDPDWEPYEKIDESGNHVGVAADFLNLIEEKINTKFTLVKTKSWNESLEYKKSGKCDILSFLNKTPKRSEFLNFTKVLYEEPEIIVAKSDITYINGFDDLNNKTIGIIKGYQLEEFLIKNYPNIKMVYVKNKEDALKKVSNGQIYASVQALLGSAYLIRKDNLLDVKIAGETKRMNQYRIGVDKNNFMLLSILDKAIELISEDDKNKIISQKISVKFEQNIDYTIIWKIILVFVLILVIVIFYLKKIQQIKSNLEEFIDSQENLIIVTDSKTTEFANTSFFEFLGFKNLQQFKEKFNCISDFFVEDDQFFHLGKVKKNENWIESILKLPHSERIVGILRYDYTIQVFTISVNKFHGDTYILSLTNMTQSYLNIIKLNDKVIRDNLTSAYNREYFNQNYQKIIIDTIKDNYKLAIAFLDIDHFKIVNDTYGHDVGDDVLIHFVNVLQRFSRTDDILIRWGGEEFILILKIRAESDLFNVLDHLRKVIEVQDFPTIGKKTCSIGGSIYKNGEDINRTIKRADDGVYEAKSAGRNKVVIK